jgi:hypothetical protein
MKLLFLWLSLVAATAFIYQRDSGLRYGHHEMCKKLQNDFVEKITSEEFRQCLKIYDKVVSFKDWEIKTNAWLGSWGWSHLSVYSPSESTEIWESKSNNIGVRLKTIENKIIVYKAHPDSVFKRGDLFIEVNGQTPLYESDILNEVGSFKIQRDGKEILLDVKTGDYFWNDKVEFTKNIMKVPSFRGEFFKDEALKEIIKKISLIQEDLIYLDLRDNIGGNVASAIRLMSVFVCDESVIGSFKIPSREEFGSSDYPLTVDQSVQVEHMKRYGEVKLRVPKNKICTSKKVKVLVNDRTASTAELVAQAFIDLKRGTVVGEKTSGRMVLSSWDQIVYFPEGFYFSHPYALYASISGSAIEGEGVLPETFKTYVLDFEILGRDSFLD